jgi:hypothetical protein
MAQQCGIYYSLKTPLIKLAFRLGKVKNSDIDLGLGRESGIAGVLVQYYG